MTGIHQGHDSELECLRLVLRFLSRFFPFFDM